MSSVERITEGEPSVRGRKRVAAREVAADIATENERAARLSPPDLDDVIEGEIVSRSEIVLPPTAPRGRVLVIDRDAVRLPDGPGRPRPDAGDTLPVVDPTLLGSRRRRRSHQRLYRATQLLVLACAGLAGAGVICTMLDEPLIGRWLAGGAMLPGAVAWAISGQSDLSRRWRGWAVAAVVFAAVAVGLTVVHERVIESDGPDAPPAKMLKR